MLVQDNRQFSAVSGGKFRWSFSTISLSYSYKKASVTHHNNEFENKG